MCGIVGAIRGGGPVLAGLIEGLRVLEYRGYDSAGVAIANGSGIRMAKRQGRLDNLEAVLADAGSGNAFERGRAGIGHTRWATHGPPTDANAHPHMGGSGKLALVHNGIIENYQDLKQELEDAGVAFVSDTDTEVLAHLIDQECGIDRKRGADGDLAEAVRRALRRVTGYYALAVLAEGESGPELVCARQGPPLAVACSDDAAFLASDVLGILPHTREIAFLEDGDVAVLTPGSVRITDFGGRAVSRQTSTIDWDPGDSGLGGWPHYMLKEIHEQPNVLARTIQGRIDEAAGDVVFEARSGVDAAAFDDASLASIQRVQVIACGTALHAGYIARYLIEGLSGIPVDVDYASEFRYRNPPLAAGTLALAITQSGETADTLAATRLARELGATVGAICNVAGSSQVRESEHVILTHAGPEIGVASTKAFTAQVVAATLLAVRMGRAKGTLSEDSARALLSELKLLRTRLESLLDDGAVEHVRRVAQSHIDQRGFLFLGRGINYPVALEGALKLKEISYMHAEGYPAGEMKHGPIALIDPGMTIVCINSAGPLAEKVLANIEQVKARGGVVLSVGSDPASHGIAGQSLEVPASSEWLSPILNTVPLQLLAYNIAEMRGCDIDKPRNLAKSVTVE